MQTIATMLWKRIDADGLDACRLLRHPHGWQLDGTATYVQDAQPCLLNYAVVCDDRWHTQSATVTGWFGDAEIRLAITHDTTAGWLLNGVVQERAAGCIDLDLSFTPATNLLALRRLDFDSANELQAPAAYLEFSDMGLERLEQTYRRITPTCYEYRAPAFEYEALLEVSEAGFVTDYPGLWTQAFNHAPLDT